MLRPCANEDDPHERRVCRDGDDVSDAGSFYKGLTLTRLLLTKRVTGTCSTTAINMFSMRNTDDQNPKNVILNIADKAIVAHTKTPVLP